MSDGAYVLKIVEGKDYGKSVQLKGDMIEVGQGKETSSVEGTITFSDQSVARLHALFLWNAAENLYHVSNRSPISPVLMDGVPCANARMIPGKHVQFGRLKLEIGTIGDMVPNVTDEALVSAAPRTESTFLGEMPTETAPKPAWLMHAGAVNTAPKGYEPPTTSYLGEEPVNQEPQRPFNTGTTPVGSSNLNSSYSAPQAAQYTPSQNDSQPQAAPIEEEKPQAPPAPPEPEPAKPLGRIQVIKGANKGRSLECFGDFTIGRSPDCDFVLTDSQVSRNHCSVEFINDEAYIVNHSTSSTTKVGKNNVKTKSVLDDSCEITLANRVVLKWARLY